MPRDQTLLVTLPISCATNLDLLDLGEKGSAVEKTFS
jgi:hypothetical protein